MKRSPNGSKIGVIGGAIGIILGVLSFLYASILTVVHLFHNLPAGTFVSSILGVIFGFLAVASAGTARKDSLLGGILLIIFAFLGFYFVGGLYVISSILVFIAGLVAIYDYVR